MRSRRSARGEVGRGNRVAAAARRLRRRAAWLCPPRPAAAGCCGPDARGGVPFCSIAYRPRPVSSRRFAVIKPPARPTPSVPSAPSQTTAAPLDVACRGSPRGSRAARRARSRRTRRDRASRRRLPPDVLRERDAVAVGERPRLAGRPRRSRSNGWSALHAEDAHGLEVRPVVAGRLDAPLPQMVLDVRGRQAEARSRRRRAPRRSSEAM